MYEKMPKHANADEHFTFSEQIAMSLVLLVYEVGFRNTLIGIGAIIFFQLASAFVSRLIVKQTVSL